MEGYRSDGPRPRTGAIVRPQEREVFSRARSTTLVRSRGPLNSDRPGDTPGVGELSCATTRSSGIEGVTGFRRRSANREGAGGDGDAGVACRNIGEVAGKWLDSGGGRRVRPATGRRACRPPGPGRPRRPRRPSAGRRPEPPDAVGLGAVSRSRLNRRRPSSRWLRRRGTAGPPWPTRHASTCGAVTSSMPADGE